MLKIHTSPSGGRYDNGMRALVGVGGVGILPTCFIIIMNKWNKGKNKMYVTLGFRKKMNDMITGVFHESPMVKASARKTTHQLCRKNEPKWDRRQPCTDVHTGKY